MSQESKEIDPKVDDAVVEEIVTSQVSNVTDNDEAEAEADEDESTDITLTNPDAVAAGSSAKKKKSKKAKLKKALGVGGGEDGGGESSSSSNPASKLTTGMVEQLLEMNPSLKSEVAGMDKEKAAATLKKLDVADLLTGMVIYVECLIVFASLTREQVCEWEKPKRHGFVQILADSASTPIWFVSAIPPYYPPLIIDRRDSACRRRSN